MAKYEIMLILNGSLKEVEATTTVNELKDLLKSSKDLKIENLGLKDLCYTIKKSNHGFYFVLNFDCNDPSEIKEFRRVASLQKNVLRQLIINLEKDYGYKATVNPKKIAKSAYRLNNYKTKKEAYIAEQEKIKRERDTSSVKLTDI